MSDDDELLDERATCAMFGGKNPIHRATLYRGMAAGRYPKPIKITPGMNRWLKSECREALRRIIAHRDGGVFAEAS